MTGGEGVVDLFSPGLGEYKYGSRYLAIDYSSQPKTETVGTRQLGSVVRQ